MNRLIGLLVVLLVMLGFVGCSKNPGTLTKSEVEAELKKELKLTEVSLTESDEGGYTGTGQNAGGTKYTLKVTQDEKDKKLSYTATDEKGTVRGGFVKHYGR